MISLSLEQPQPYATRHPVVEDRAATGSRHVKRVFGDKTVIADLVTTTSKAYNGIRASMVVPDANPPFIVYPQKVEKRQGFVVVGLAVIALSVGILGRSSGRTI